MTQVHKDVLNGWKEIAAYLGRDPRTVERWEKTRSLPVRRLPGAGRATVYALVPELDAWLATPFRGSAQSSPDSSDRAEVRPVEVVPSPKPAASAAPVASPGTPMKIRPATGGGRLWFVLVPGVLVAMGILLATAVWHHRRAETASTAVTHLRPLVPPSAVPGVEELYLRGSYQAEMRTPESLNHAQESFSEALKREPRYAPALAGLASTFILLREYSTAPDSDAYQKAQDAARQAVAMDPTLAQAHAVLGFVDFFWNWDATGAEREFHTALQLAPHLPLAHHWYGSMLTHQGRYQDALRELNLAQQLEPSSAAILTTRALALGLSGRRQESSDLLNEAISNEKGGAFHNPATMHQVMATLSLLPPRNVARYLSESTIAAELRQDGRQVSDLRLAEEIFQAQGEHAMWQALLAQDHRRHEADRPTYAMARYEAELGDRDQALADLSILVSRHDAALIGITVDPLLAPLQSDPRFARVRSSVGL